MVYVKQDSDIILSTLDKGLHVLEILGAVDALAGLTLTELSRAAGMHRTTLFRILATLQARGLVARDDATDRYRLGIGVLALASALLRDIDIRRVAWPALRALSRRTQELVYLTVLDKAEVVTVERFDSDQDISLRADIGSRRPAYCTASGKAILAHLPAEDVDRILQLGMPTLTPRTITSPEVMQHHLEEVRQRGFAWDDEERLEGVRCVAAPVFGGDGSVGGAVSIAAPSLRTPWARLRQLGDEVCITATEISRQLGFVARKAG